MPLPSSSLRGSRRSTGSWGRGGCHCQALPPLTPLCWLWPYLRPVAHLQERTGGVEGPGAAGQHVGAVVGVQQLHEVHALGLAGSRGGDGEASPGGVAFRGSRSPVHPTSSFLLHQLRQVPAWAPGTWGPSVPSPAQPSPTHLPAEWVPGEAKVCVGPCDSQAPKKNHMSPHPDSLPPDSTTSSPCPHPGWNRQASV